MVILKLTFGLKDILNYTLKLRLTHDSLIFYEKLRIVLDFLNNLIKHFFQNLEKKLLDLVKIFCYLYKFSLRTFIYFKQLNKKILKRIKKS